jgi:hypothetical protein
VRAFRTFVLQDAVERIQPLVCLLWIIVRKCCHVSTLDEVAFFQGTEAFVTPCPRYEKL